MKQHLVLFDIDGTLLKTNGQALAVMGEAMGEVYDIKPDWKAHTLDGRTDFDIVHTLLESHGLKEAEIEAGLEQYWQRYQALLEERLCMEKITVCSGVREVVAALRGKEEVCLGLLTGNIAKGAEIKIRAIGLEGFICGAFGDRERKRSALPAQALVSAKEATGQSFSGKQIVIIGDTPNDIHCGAHLGAKTIAVATGNYDYDALKAHSPDHLFYNFAFTEAVVAAIEA